MDEDDPLVQDIHDVLLEHEAAYSLREMEMALQIESQAVREMQSTSKADEERA